jgi:hypothetical protein
MAHGGRPDEKVHVTDRPVQPSQAPAFATKDACHSSSKFSTWYTTREAVEDCLSVRRIGREIDPFVQFSERYYRDAESRVGQFFEFRVYIQSAAKRMNDPICIDEIRHRSKAWDRSPTFNSARSIDVFQESVRVDEPLPST